MWTEAEIVPYRDGPYLIRGAFTIKDQDGRRIETSRRTVALCRCGKSRLRPFCDGTHRLIRFRAASNAERTVSDEPEQRSLAGSDGSAPDGSEGNAGQPRSKTAALFDQPETGSRTGAKAPEKPQRPSGRLGLVYEELKKADTGLEGLDCQLSGNTATQIGAARPLVAAARAFVENLAANTATGQVGRETANEVGPCLCLVQGALASLMAHSDESDAIRQVVGQLRSAAGHLDLPHHPR